jgi:peptidoglycan/LPS O-acetylase OafA/YrhL
VPEMQTSPAQSSYFPALTGVRTIAAWLVFFHHYNPFSVQRFGSVISQFVGEFHVGVSIFFVLSGFLITHRYFNSNFSWRTYLVSRVARVYPMYFIITTITFILQTDTSWFVYFMNITFLRGFFDEFKFSLVSQGWSLTVEECFYLLAPLVFILVRKSKSVLILLPAFLVGVGCVLVLLFGSIGTYGFFKDFNFMFIYTFFGRCFEFFCGVALALYLKSDSRQGGWYTWISLWISGMLVFIMSRFGSEGVSGIQSTAGIAINNFLMPIAIMFFFHGLVREQSIIKSLLGSKPFQLMGKASYMFYLIHVGVIGFWLHNLAFGNLFLLFLGLSAVSIILWKYLEEPLNQYIRRLLS